MENTLWQFLLGIPQYLAQFSDWLLSPIGNGIDVSPLGLFGIGGATVLIFIIGVHVVRMFV